MNNRRQRHPHRDRRGGALVEFAVCLPVIVVLVLGAIECCSMIFVNQSLHVVAYEGIRTAIRHESTTQEVMARCDQVIAERKLRGAQVTLTPDEVATVERGEPVTIHVTAPCDPNSVMKLKFFSGALDADVVMIKE
jgi:Flp pilus assembly protein TadG